MKDEGVTIRATIKGDPDAVKDVDLPLWNKDHTDVLPEYQLTHGHIVCQARMTPGEVKRLGKCLGLGAIEYADNFDADRLPVEPTSGCRTLGAEEEAHLLIAEVGGHYAVFGPHKLFFNSERWLRWNKRARGLMAYATQGDMTEFFYTVFRKGQRLLDACWEGDSIRYIEDAPIEVHLDGKRIYHDPGGKPQVTEEIVALLGSDARITNEDGVITIRALSSDQSVEHLMHYIFRKPQRKGISLWAG